MFYPSFVNNFIAPAEYAKDVQEKERLRHVQTFQISFRERRKKKRGKTTCRQSSVCNMDIHDMTSVTRRSEFYLRVDIKVKYKCCTLLSLHKEAKHEKQSRYRRSFSFNSNSKLIRIAAQRGVFNNSNCTQPVQSPV